MAPALLGVVVWSAVAEFLLLRVSLRLGPVLPAQEALLPAYRVVETLGLAALNLAVLAAAGLAASVAAGFIWRGPGGVGVRHAAPLLAALAIAAAVLTNLGLGMVLAVAPAPVVVTLQAATTMAAVVAVTVLRWPPGRGRVALRLIAAAQVLALYHVVTQGAAGLGVHLPGGGRPAFLAEALAVAAALALPWSFRVRPHRREVALGVGLGLVFLAAHTARAWTVATLAMWTVSFSLFLPGFLYAAAVAAGAATLLTLRRDRDTGPVAAGLLLVALAGLKLDFTYFAVLSLVGLLVAGQSPTGAGTAARTSQPEPTVPAPAEGERR